jgi:hypothetical protein
VGGGEGRGEANSNNSIQLLLTVLVQQGEVFRLRKHTLIGKTCDFCSFTFVRHVTGTGSGLLGGIPRVVVQISALT